MDLDAWMQVYYIRTRKRKRKKNGTFPSIITTITTETGCYRASWLDAAAATATPVTPINAIMHLIGPSCFAVLRPGTEVPVVDTNHIS